MLKLDNIFECRTAKGNENELFFEYYIPGSSSRYRQYIDRDDLLQELLKLGYTWEFTENMLKIFY